MVSEAMMMPFYPLHAGSAVVGTALREPANALHQHSTVGMEYEAKLCARVSQLCYLWENDLRPHRYGPLTQDNEYKGHKDYVVYTAESGQCIIGFTGTSRPWHLLHDAGLFIGVSTHNNSLVQ